MKPLIERLDELHAACRGLDPDAEQRGAWLEAVAAYAERWMASLPDLPGYVPDDERAASALEPLVEEEPAELAEVLAVLAEAVDRIGVNESSPHFFGFIPGSGLYSGALGDYLADVVNRYVGVAYAGPGAARLERRLVKWLASELGYPDTAAGDLTSGGSIANLSAIVTAREAHGIRAADVERAVVYLSDQTHHSVAKALRIAGLGECVLRQIPLDPHWHMRPDALSERIAHDRRRGLRPWLVVASAGATDTGAVDPLSEIATVAEDEALWLHVDAAYGGAFGLCEPGRRILSGIERADSIVVDPHKGLFLPFGTGLLLVRDGDALRRAHSYDASYLQDAERANLDAVSSSELSPELTRPFRGLRLWLSLRLAGVSAFRAALEEKLLLARYFRERLSLQPELEVGPAPDLSVVTWRLAPEFAGDGDARSEAVADAIRRDGRIFLSTTRLDGRFAFRLAILNVRSHRAEIERAVGVIAEMTRKVVADRPPEGRTSADR